jgi:TrmH family RNA methyltransferase
MFLNETPSRAGLYYGSIMEIGKHNRKLVELRKAFQHSTLTTDDLLPIEGPILLEEARRSGIEIVDVFVRAGTAMPESIHQQCHEVSDETFKSIQDTEHSQGLIATVRPRRFTFAAVLDKAPALVVVLGRLQDPGNVGTILRVAESFDATGCIALSGTASFHNGKVARASAGSIFRIPHVGVADLKTVATLLREKRIAIVGTSPSAHRTIADWDWRRPAAVLVGNEGGGLSGEELSYCDAVLRIPHNRTVESLNSAISAAVILYEASRQRH